MTIAALVDLILLAVVVSVSPFPVIAMILVLFSRAALRNGTAFLVTVAAVALVVPAAVAFAVDASGDDAGGGGGSSLKGWALLALGALLLVLARRNWSRRASGKVPAVFDKIAEMGIIGVTTLAMGTTLLNPKNLVMYVSAGAALGALDLEVGPTAGLAAVFCIVSTLPLWASLAYLAAGGAQASRRLQRLKDWLMHNNKAIMAVVLAVLGGIVIVNGLTAL
jgi:threonine/homoserine/homoserine lactone efflux protein